MCSNQLHFPLDLIQRNNDAQFSCFESLYRRGTSTYRSTNCRPRTSTNTTNGSTKLCTNSCPRRCSRSIRGSHHGQLVLVLIPLPANPREESGRLLIIFTGKNGIVICLELQGCLCRLRITHKLVKISIRKLGDGLCLHSGDCILCCLKAV